MPETTLNKRGGQRPNAGRKKGSSAYGESTTAIRVPESLVPTIKTLLDDRKRQFEQLANSTAAILFPSKTPSSLPCRCLAAKWQPGFRPLPMITSRKPWI